LPVVVTALAFTPDGQRLVVGGHHRTDRLDAAEGKLGAARPHSAERALRPAVPADGKLVAAGGRPGQEGDARAYD